MIRHYVSASLIRIIGALARLLGKMIERDVDPVTGKDRRTGAKLEEKRDD